MTGIFMYFSLPTADTIVYKAHILFVNQCSVIIIINNNGFV